MSAASRGRETALLRADMVRATNTIVDLRDQNLRLIRERDNLLSQVQELQEVNRSLKAAIEKLQAMWNRAHLGNEKPF